MNEPPWATIATLHYQSDAWCIRSEYTHECKIRCVGSEVTSLASECPGCLSVESRVVFTTAAEAGEYYCRFYKLGPYAVTLEDN